MMQSKSELAGQLFLDLDGCSAHAVDADDRRHVMQVNNYSQVLCVIVLKCALFGFLL